MKQLYLIFFFSCLISAGYAQDWVIYDASAAPADNVDPVWNASNGTEGTWTAMPDPDVEGNSIVLHESLGAAGGMYKTDDFTTTPTEFTAVIRVKAGPSTSTAVEELDLHVNGMRDQLIIYSDNTLELTRSGGTVDLNGILDVTEWNTFRITVDATAGTEGIVNVYLNENPSPVLTATTTTATTANYFRFGDGQSTKTYSSYIDFLIWDTSGAYAPGESPIPESLMPAADNWVVYDASAVPAENVDPVWNASNGTEGTWTAMPDPDVEGNSIVLHESLGAAGGMYKTDDFTTTPTEFTGAIRVKAGPSTSTAVAELDLHVNGMRDQLIIYSDNTLELTRSGGTVDLNGILDVTEWNTFRITVDATAGTEGIVNVYLNEDPTAVLTATTTTATTANYFRFGDGQSTKTYSSYIDFITWDITGAYAPDEQALPEGLIPEETIPVGDWIMYTADNAPADNTDPVLNASNGTEGTWTAMPDPDVTGNSIVMHESLGAAGGMYKTDDFAAVPQALTTVFRTKFNEGADGVFEMDLHVNGIRDQLIIYADNTMKLARSSATVDLAGTLDVRNWNVFRMTVDATSGTEATVNIYLNEDPDPVLTAVSTTVTTANYLRFGDGQSSVTYSAYIDFIVWDLTGAYSPEEAALPAGLVPTPDVGDWVIYTADNAPADNTDPVLNASNGTEGTWTVTADPDVEGNNLVIHESLGAAGGMYKTDDFTAVPQALTTVFRTKFNEGADGVFEMDLHVNGIRDQLIIYANNSIKLTRSSVTVDLTGTLDVTKWNVFRMTVDASAGTEATVNVYLNEDPTPVLTSVSTTVTTANYLRFGDGQSSVTYSALIDFIAWDVNGAYNPQERILPPGLIPGTDVTNDDSAFLAELQVNGETVSLFNGANFSYDVELPYGTTTVPTVTATALYPSTVTITITDATSLPGITTVLVEANDGSQETYNINFTVAPNFDASITSLMVNGTEIPGFDAAVTSYEYGVPVGSTAIPTLTVTTTDPNASFSVEDAPQIPGTSVVTITAEDGTTTSSYEVKFFHAVSDDASLSDIQINGSTIPGFDPATLNYNIEFDDLIIPGIIPTTNHPNAIAYVNYPESLDGSTPVDATIEVTAEDGETQLVYTISMTTSVVLGLEDEHIFSIYPNPFVNEINIGNVSSSAKVTIYNSSGKIVLVRGSFENSVRLDVSVLDKGMYFIRIETSDRMETFKMTK